MKRPSRQRNLLKKMPLDIKAEMALKEAVSEAIAEHKLRGHPIIIWQDGKVVAIPPEEIVVRTVKRGNPSNDKALFVKEESLSYSKKSRTK